MNVTIFVALALIVISISYPALRPFVYPIYEAVKEKRPGVVAPRNPIKEPKYKITPDRSAR